MISLNYWVFALFFIGIFVSGFICGFGVGFREYKKDDNKNDTVVESTERCTKPKLQGKPQLIINYKHNGDEMKLADKLVSEMSHSYFETSMMSEFDHTFKSICETNGYDVAANVLHCIIESTTDDYIINGVIHILSTAVDRDYGGYYSQESVHDFVITICEEAVKKMSSMKCGNQIEFCDLILVCLEWWHIEKSIPLLKSLDIPEDEVSLREYRDDVIDYIRTK